MAKKDTKLSPVDRARSLAAKKGAATRALNRQIAEAERSRKHLHAKIVGAGMIVAVAVFAFIGIKSQIDAYAATQSQGSFVGLAGKCLDNSYNNHKNGNELWLFRCNGSAAQKWTVSSAGVIEAAGSGYCLDIPGNSKAEYTYLQLYKCNNTSAQKFKLQGGAIVSQSTKFCVTVKYSSTANNTRLWTNKCKSPAANAQKWTFKTASTGTGNTGSGSGTGTGTGTGSGTGSGDIGTPPTTGTTAGSGKFKKYQVPARGWWSGASGNGADYGSTAFGSWRGDPIDAISTWIDSENGAAWGYGPGTDGGPIKNFKGLADIAIGGPTDYGAAANGSMDNQLRALLTRIKAYRTAQAPNAPTVIRPFHEMNGNWYGYSVTPDNLANFKKTAKRWSQIAKEVYPEAIWEISFNGDSRNVTPAQMYEDGVWDAVGVDRYNQYPYIGKNLNGGYTSWEAGSNLGTVDNPVGVEKWRQFAAARGIPMAFPEYANHGPGDGNNDQSGDDPYWVNSFFAWVKKNRGTGSGQIFAEMWFNIPKEGNKWHLTGSPDTLQPNVANAYANIFPVKY